MSSEEKDAEGKTETFTIAGTTFTVDRRYQLIKPIGHGAYGVVVSAKDKKTGEMVAIKKVPRAFEDLVDAKRILREIKLLRHFQHENVLGLVDILQPEGAIENFEDVYMVMGLMETDLHRIIYSKQPLSDDHVQYFVYQMLRALKYMHSAGVLHRDLKPSNLLLNSNCDLKVCDFGLARGVNDGDVDLTEYVVTRWYRAPEIMLSCQEYSVGIDVWSVGCILAELLQRKPLFPGEDYIHQLQIIMQSLGTPSESELDFVSSEKARRFMLSQPKTSRTLGAQFGSKWSNPKCPKPNAEAVDLLEKMLVFDPARRISVEDALTHPYMASLANPEDEPLCPNKFTFEFENSSLQVVVPQPRVATQRVRSRHDFNQLTVPPSHPIVERHVCRGKIHLQELIWQELAAFHPDAQQKFNERRAAGKMQIDTLAK